MSGTNTPHNIDTDELLSGFEAQLTKSKSESTVNEYTRHAGDYIQWVERHGIDLFDVKPSEVKDHLGETLEEGYAPGYLKIRRAAIRSLYDEAHHIAESRTTDGLEKVDPTDIGANPADPERMTMDFSDLDKGSKQSQAAKEDYVAVDADDVADMVENVPPSHAKGEDHRLLLKLLFYTGLRKSEVVRIKLSDFDDSDTFRGERSINIRAIKTDSNRTVYYPPQLVSDLDSWVNGVGRDLILGKRDSEYLFPSPDMAPGDDEPISHQHVNRVVKESARGAGIQDQMYTDMNGNTRWKITSHSLRHGFAESCIEEGMDLRTLAELMGHFKKDGTPAIGTTTMYLRGIDNGEQYEHHGPPEVEVDTDTE
jgi:integrase/recombinase XerD